MWQSDSLKLTDVYRLWGKYVAWYVKPVRPPVVPLNIFDKDVGREIHFVGCCVLLLQTLQFNVYQNKLTSCVLNINHFRDHQSL